MLFNLHWVTGDDNRNKEVEEKVNVIVDISSVALELKTRPS